MRWTGTDQGVRAGSRAWAVRALSLVMMLVSLQIGSLIAPAYACGCGAMVVDRNSQVSVDRETSVVSWSGGAEQIVMQLTVRGTAPEAAWIMPVPHRATVELGDASLFSELETLTAPVRETRHYFWPHADDWPFGGSGSTSGDSAAPSAAAPVGVVGRERLGPFDVARLTATDPTALEGWLTENGFELPDRLSTALRPYVEQKWEYVAIRLAPQEKGGPLLGQARPAAAAFRQRRAGLPDAAVPARHDTAVVGAVRAGGAPHGAARPDRRAWLPEVTYAERVDTGRDGGAYPALGELTGGKPVFLTAISQSFPRPERIDGDHELRATAADTPYRTTYYRDELLTVGPVPAWVLTLIGGVAVAVAAVLLLARSRRRRPVAPPPPVMAPPPLR